MDWTKLQIALQKEAQGMMDSARNQIGPTQVVITRSNGMLLAAVARALEEALKKEGSE